MGLDSDFMEFLTGIPAIDLPEEPAELEDASIPVLEHQVARNRKNLREAHAENQELRRQNQALGQQVEQQEKAKKFWQGQASASNDNLGQVFREQKKQNK